MLLKLTNCTEERSGVSMLWLGPSNNMLLCWNKWWKHYIDVIMGAVASQIASLTIVYSTVYSDADQRKHQSSASLAFVRGIHRGPVNSPHKWSVTRRMFPFDDVIMITIALCVARLLHWTHLIPIKHELYWELGPFKVKFDTRRNFGP